MANVKEFLYKELFSTSAEAMELFARSMGKATKYDAFGGRTVFSAVVLTKPIILSSADLHAVKSAAVRGTLTVSNISKFAFKARIIDDPSPHGFLPDPCAASISSKPKKQMNRAFLHTTFISANPYDMSTNAMPKVGDIVKVKLNKNVFSYDMSYGVYLSTITNNNGRAPGWESEPCLEIDSYFGSGLVSTGGNYTGVFNRSTRFGKAGEKRNVPFATFKNPPGCKPRDQGAIDVTDYFTPAQWTSFKLSLSTFEGNYASVNPWGYMGKYQLSVHNMYAYGKGVITKAAYDAVGGTSFKHKGKMGTSTQKLTGAKMKALYDANSTWASKDGVTTRAQWIANKNDIQESMFLILTNRNFAELKKAGAVDIDNASDVAGMLAASHLLGRGGAQNLRKGVVGSDGNAMPGAVYYVVVGRETCM